MYGLGPEKSLRLVYETFFLAIALLFTSSSIIKRFETGSEVNAFA
jgi:hypothetical protein